MKLNRKSIDIIMILKALYDSNPQTYLDFIRFSFNRTQFHERLINELFVKGIQYLMPGTRWYYNATQLNWAGFGGVEKFALKSKDLTEYAMFKRRIEKNYPNYFDYDSKLLSYESSMFQSLDAFDGELFINDLSNDDGSNFRIMVEITQPYFDDYYVFIKKLADIKMTLPIEIEKLKRFIQTQI